MKNLDLSNYIDINECASLSGICRTALRYKLKDLKFKFITVHNPRGKAKQLFKKDDFLQLIASGKLQKDARKSSISRSKVRVDSDGFPLKKINYDDLVEATRFTRLMFRF